jgi:hypothetical protein
LEKTLLVAVLYLAATFGLVAATLIPLRGWQRLRGSEPPGLGAMGSRTRLAVLSCVAGGAVVADLMLVWKIFGCLTGEHCGPNRASGLLLLVSIGFWYVLFEALANAIEQISRRLGRAA